MSDPIKAIDYVLNNEGGLNEDPNDRGGITNRGISLRFLRQLSPERLKIYEIYGPVDDDTIKDLTLEQTKKIYKGEFWDNAPFERISNQDHCNYIFDMAVNMGLSPAIKCAQRACWAACKNYTILAEDGILGSDTIRILKDCSFFLMPALRAERANYYRNIINSHPDQKCFLKTWYYRTYKGFN